MLRDDAILKRRIFLSNVSHSGLSKVIYFSACNVILEFHWSRNDLDFKSREHFVHNFTSHMVTIENSCAVFYKYFKS